jgi:hypothetical protein
MITNITRRKNTTNQNIMLKLRCHFMLNRCTTKALLKMRKTWLVIELMSPDTISRLTITITKITKRVTRPNDLLIQRILDESNELKNDRLVVI